ncbi:UbiA family prenyltransferase [Rhizohabitans arisaemae]|uniref:UbiA family prenyltransferase n=1 Tax=Rhizohabitans arisaemae TaxID=2720610 RepID=UPI0024B201D9|nr:UbiA family prenyltransferase [Rhizohabitans arisaemae]
MTHQSFKISASASTVVTPNWRTLRLAWVEARPVVQVIFQLRLVVGALLAAGGLSGVTWGTMMTGASAWLFLTWSVYLVNGAADIVEDRSNGSNRPIARDDLSSVTAGRLAMLLGTLGLLFAAGVSERFFVLALLLLVLGWVYSTGPAPLKNTVAGVQVAVVGAGIVTYLAGMNAAGIPVNSAMLVFAVAMSAWMGIGGLAKDLSDIEGDRDAGRRTLPLIWGDRGAKIVVGLGAGAVGVAFVTGALICAPGLLGAACLVLAGGLGLAVSALGRWSVGNRSRRRLPYRVFMITQYSTHLLVLTDLVAW